MQEWQYLSQKSRGIRPAGIVAPFSACPIVCCCSQQFLFPGLEVSIQGTAFVRSATRPYQDSVDVDTIHVSRADILVSQVRKATVRPT